MEMAASSVCDSFPICHIMNNGANPTTPDAKEGMPHVELQLRGTKCAYDDDALWVLL